jgi:hypothetical protein
MASHVTDWRHRRQDDFAVRLPRFDKLDVMFVGFISFALIADGISP